MIAIANTPSLNASSRVVFMGDQDTCDLQAAIHQDVAALSLWGGEVAGDVFGGVGDVLGCSLGPEVLQPGEIAEPELGGRDVRVELRAAGVNPVDYSGFGDVKRPQM